MDTCEQDRLILECFAVTIGLNPNGRLCPDLEAIANEDYSLQSKVKRFRGDLAHNIRAACNGSL